MSVFWHKVWTEAGCPTAGVLFNIKCNAKSRFKYAIRRLKHRKEFLIREKLARPFVARRKDQFWSEIRQLNRVKNSNAPSVDGITGDQHIANLFSSRFKNLLNNNPSPSHNALFSHIQSLLSSSMLNDLLFTENEVVDAIGRLKPSSDGVSSEHLQLSCSVIALPLSLVFFSSVVQHGHMPHILRDSILVPVPKGSKDASVSANYRPIVLSSTLSKVLEWLILSKYSEFFSSSHLQFGFKSGSSTSLCTGTVKNIVARYIRNGSSVFGCFLDASKAFDMVDHNFANS